MIFIRQGCHSSQAWRQRNGGENDERSEWLRCLQPTVCLCLKDDPSDKRDTERKYQRRAQLLEAVFALADPLTAENFWVHTDGGRDGGRGAVQTVGRRKRRETTGTLIPAGHVTRY